MEDIHFSCTVCFAECCVNPQGTQRKVRGWQKHPICEQCYNDYLSYAEWMRQLKIKHPDIYSVQKTVGK